VKWNVQLYTPPVGRLKPGPGGMAPETVPADVTLPPVTSVRGKGRRRRPLPAHTV